MMKTLRERWAPLFALAAGMALVMSAYAGEGHGHGDAASEPVEAKEPPIGRVTLKPNLKDKVEAPSPSESKEGKGEGKSEGRAASRSKRGEEREGGASRDAKPTAEAASDAKANVSMAELRDLIDQKIAEVRTKREAPPVVRLRAKPVAARTAKSPASGAHAGATTLAMNDAQGALLPAGADGEAHGLASTKSAQGDARLANAMGHDVHWAYSGDTGPDSWGRLKPEFQQCMVGKRQSPIDIRDGIPVQLDPIQFDYRPSNFRVIDNGHTVQVNVEPGNGITVMGHRYELVQFHFHRPSEERINGRQYEMVAHLVHKDMDGRLAVVAVLMDQGKSHPLVQQVWNNLPLEKNLEQAAMNQIDLGQLLPEQRQYYTYMGSLTTPPCSEGVLWMVMKQPAGVSREQIGVFAKLYPMNARPVQSASGRLIKDGQ